MLKAILTIGVAALSLSGADGQATPDRTTEKGESSIKGEVFIFSRTSPNAKEGSRLAPLRVSCNT